MEYLTKIKFKKQNHQCQVKFHIYKNHFLKIIKTAILIIKPFSQFTWHWQAWHQDTLGPSIMYQCVSVCLHEWWSRWRYTSMISSLWHLVRPVLHFSLFVFHLLALFAFPTTTGSSSHVCLVNWSWLRPYICLTGCPKLTVVCCPIIAVTQADFCLEKIYYYHFHKNRWFFES